MKPLIENGYVYIARPPLYKVKKGNKELYIQDDTQFDRYLTDIGSVNSKLVFSNNKEYSGNELKSFVLKAKRFKDLVEKSSLKHPFLMEELIMANYDLNTLKNNLHRHFDGTWNVELKDDHYIFDRDIEGIKENYRIHSFEKIDLPAHFEDFAFDCKFVTKDTEISINSPTKFYDTFMDLAKKRLAIQRYKGLGEMNPEQLWETTLDPEVRSLTQVKMNGTEGETFSMLMGDIVEPRRKFIQENALNVVNLDF